MEIFIHRLLSELIAGDGCQLIVHPEMDKGTFPKAQYEINFSKENTRVHYESELIEINRPLEKSIFLVGTGSTEERPVSYAMPYNVESLAGSKWNRSGHDVLVEVTYVVRISMITEDKAERQAKAQLHYMQLFAQQALRNPPTQQWWTWPATLVGFTSLFNLPHENIMGFNEEEVQGSWFGARFVERMIPSEHVAIRKL